MSLEIGKIKLDYPFLQAPLSGYTDSAMRQISVRYGCPLTFGALILDKSVVHRKILRNPNHQIDDDTHPVGGQLLGSDPEKMAFAAEILEKTGYDLIDLNFACPAPKVLRRGRGGALLTDPERVIEIFRRVRAVVNCPLTVKLRAGYGHSPENQDKFWQICRQTVAEGVDALMVHGRTVLERYRGRADWQVVRQVKREFPQTTVIGSGDIFSAEDITEKLTGGLLDGVLVARGAIGNPWIFNETRELMDTGKLPDPPDIAEQKDVILRHLELLLRYYPEPKAVAHFRKFTVHYSRRHPQRKPVMLDLMAAKTIPQLREYIDKWYNVD